MIKHVLWQKERSIKMLFEIKSRWNASVLFSIETTSIRLAVEAAVKSGANLAEANLAGADLTRANLAGAKGMYKIMGVEVGNCYWKRFDAGLKNNNYQFRVGLNVLQEGEKFADDERISCSYPAFHFASRSWCAMFYPDRPLEAHIRIPIDAKINEPWAADGKASADRIEILQVFDVKTGIEVTEDYR
jgi:hypothetical protein